MSIYLQNLVSIVCGLSRFSCLGPEELSGTFSFRRLLNAVCASPRAPRTSSLKFGEIWQCLFEFAPNANILLFFFYVILHVWTRLKVHIPANLNGSLFEKSSENLFQVAKIIKVVQDEVAICRFLPSASKHDYD